MKPQKTHALSQTELIALIAMMFATVAFSIDAMLPSMLQIATDLQLAVPQNASLVITTFLMGMGLGTLFAGPLSDSLGRKPVVFGGLAIYAAGAIMASMAQSLEMMIAGRLVQGLGAAGPRVVSAAIIRDLYSGPAMARILSLAMTLFLIVPALAPMLGAWIAALLGWRAVFAAFLVFAAVLMVWFGRRLHETLPKAGRIAFRPRVIARAMAEVWSNPVSRLSILVQTLLMGLLFSILTMVQPIFDISFGRADSFPYWFGAIAVVAASSTVLNSSLVMRYGMRRLATVALFVQIGISIAALVAMQLMPDAAFGIFIAWLLTVFFQAGMTTANLNTIALGPVGHIAGTAATVMGAVSTIGGAILGSLIAQTFDGTPRPLLYAALGLVVLASILLQRMRRYDGA